MKGSVAAVADEQFVLAFLALALLADLALVAAPVESLSHLAVQLRGAATPVPPAGTFLAI